MQIFNALSLHADEKRPPRWNIIPNTANIPKKAAFYSIVEHLEDKGFLKDYVFSGLSELIRLGNNAAHGDKVNKNAIDWVLNIGPQIFRDLDGIKNINKTLIIIIIAILASIIFKNPLLSILILNSPNLYYQISKYNPTICPNYLYSFLVCYNL